MKSDKYQVDDIAHREKNCDFTAQYFVQSQWDIVQGRMEL